MIMKYLLLLAFLLGCSVDEDKKYEDYGDIYPENDNTFFIKKENHQVGWGQGNCFLCHNTNNIHQVDLIKNIAVDLEGIQKIIAEEGEDSCYSCHGTMGTNKIID